MCELRISNHILHSLSLSDRVANCTRIDIEKEAALLGRVLIRLDKLRTTSVFATHPGPEEVWRHIPNSAGAPERFRRWWYFVHKDAAVTVP